MERRQRPMTAQPCSKAAPSAPELMSMDQRIPTPRIQSVLKEAEEALLQTQASTTLVTALNGTPVRSRTAVERTIFERAASSSSIQDVSRAAVPVAASSPVSVAAMEEASSAVGPRELLRMKSRLQSTSPWAIHSESIAKEAVSSRESERRRRQQQDKAWVEWLDHEVRRRKEEQAAAREMRLQQERRTADVITALERRRAMQLDEYRRSIQAAQRMQFEAQQDAERIRDNARRQEIEADLTRVRIQAQEEAAKKQREEEERRLRRVSCANESMRLAYEKRCRDQQRAGQKRHLNEPLDASGNEYTLYLDRKRSEFDNTLRQKREHVARRATSALPTRPISRQEQLQSRCEQVAVESAILDTKIDKEIRQHEKANLEQSRVQLRLELERQAQEKRVAKLRQRQEDVADGLSRIERDRLAKLAYEERLAQLKKEQQRVIGEQLQLQMLHSLTATMSAVAAGHE